MIARRLAILYALMEILRRMFVPILSTVARPMFAARSMGFEDEKRIFMPIRIRRHDKFGPEPPLFLWRLMQLGNGRSAWYAGQSKQCSAHIR